MSYPALYRAVLFLVYLAALALPGGKLLGLIDWSWWIVTSPVWLVSFIMLAAWGLLSILQYPRPPP